MTTRNNDNEPIKKTQETDVVSWVTSFSPTATVAAPVTTNESSWLVGWFLLPLQQQLWQPQWPPTSLHDSLVGFFFLSNNNHSSPNNHQWVFMTRWWVPSPSRTTTTAAMTAVQPVPHHHIGPPPPSLLPLATTLHLTTMMMCACIDKWWHGTLLVFLFL